MTPDNLETCPYHDVTCKFTFKGLPASLLCCTKSLRRAMRKSPCNVRSWTCTKLLVIEGKQTAFLPKDGVHLMRTKPAQAIWQRVNLPPTKQIGGAQGSGDKNVTSSTMMCETEVRCGSEARRRSRMPVVQKRRRVSEVEAASRRTWYPTKLPGVPAIHPHLSIVR